MFVLHSLSHFILTEVLIDQLVHRLFLKYECTPFIYSFIRNIIDLHLFHPVPPQPPH